MPPALARALLAAALCHALGAATHAAAFDDQLRDEIGRLRQLASPHRVEDEQRRQSLQRLLDRLGDAEAELEAGRPYYALARLDAARSNLEPLVYLLASSAIEKAGLDELEAEWREVGESLAAKEAAYREARPAAAPVAVRALGEAAWRRSRPYYLSSLSFAKASGNEAGLYYLGAARERLGFALFCRRLGAGTLPPPPAVEGLAPSLERLEAEIGAAYADADAAIEHHSRFIGLNSAMKEARELDADGLGYGALYKLLDARRRLEEIRAVAASPPEAAGLRRRADSWRRRLEARAGAADHSLGRLFLERAEASLGRAEADGDDLESAAVVLEIVLPEYFRLIEEPEP